MDQQHDLRSTQSYYDRFSPSYERERHHGYHQLIDELELELVRRHGTGRDILEAGCGTGLLLAEAARVGRSAIGLDLSRGMLEQARGRGLRVVQGSLTTLPLPDASVDLVYSMKVLAHVPPIREAIAELARVTRPADTCCSNSTTRAPCATWPRCLAARRPSRTAPRIAMSSPATTPWKPHAATCRPTWNTSACAGCAW
jgi:ubiquinone/menaquinone biosynthesis C-methylase UbiE